ncbi:unnamed protein product [Rhizophagus irregularis]|nr:unnamed protein product [Rhizophagus irregularis]
MVEEFISVWRCIYSRISTSPTDYSVFNEDFDMKFKNIGNDPKKPGGGEVSFQYKIFSEGNNKEDYNGLENYNRLELDFCKKNATVESEPASGGEAKKELKLQHWPALWIFGFGLDGISCG